MDSLPTELQTIVLSLTSDHTPEGLQTLLNLCSTNKRFRDLCNDESFWRQLYQQIRPRKPQGLSWRQSYINVVRGRRYRTRSISGILESLFIVEHVKGRAGEFLTHIEDVHFRRDISGVDKNGTPYNFSAGNYVYIAELHDDAIYIYYNKYRMKDRRGTYDLRLFLEDHPEIQIPEDEDPEDYVTDLITDDEYDIGIEIPFELTLTIN